MANAHRVPYAFAPSAFQRVAFLQTYQTAMAIVVRAGALRVGRIYISPIGAAFFETRGREIRTRNLQRHTRLPEWAFVK